MTAPASCAPPTPAPATPAPAADAGVATVWTAFAVVVLLLSMLAALDLGVAVSIRHQAAAAADLAALAAASGVVGGGVVGGGVVGGEQEACGRARRIAERMGATVTLCTLSGWDALIEVAVDRPLSLLGQARARGRAHAGPVDMSPVSAVPLVPSTGAARRESGDVTSRPAVERRATDPQKSTTVR